MCGRGGVGGSVGAAVGRKVTVNEIVFPSPADILATASSGEVAPSIAICLLITYWAIGVASMFEVFGQNVSYILSDKLFSHCLRLAHGLSGRKLLVSGSMQDKSIARAIGVATADTASPIFMRWLFIVAVNQRVNFV